MYTNTHKFVDSSESPVNSWPSGSLGKTMNGWSQSSLHWNILENDFFLKVGFFSASRDTAVGGRMIGHMNDDEEDYDESGQNWGSQ